MAEKDNKKLDESPRKTLEGLQSSPGKIREWLKTGKNELSESLDRLKKSNWRRTLLIYFSAAAVSFLIIAVIIALLGKDPVRAYAFFLVETVGTTYGFSETLLRATPLLFIGLGLAIAFSGKFWNTGAEGQMYFGVIGSSAIGFLLWDNFHPAISLPLIFLFGFLGGALWCLIPALLKTKLGVDEIISTLMLNFVALYFLQYLVFEPWRDPAAQQNFSPPFPDVLHLARLIPGLRLHFGLILALLCVPLVFIIMKRSVLGYEIRVLGGSKEAARYGGIDITRTTLKLALLSGGLAGLAGMSEIFGIQLRVLDGFSLGFGFTAIMVAFLARNNALGVFIMSIFFGAIIEGGDAMKRGAGIPEAVSSALMGLILVMVLVIEMALFLRRRGENS
jgi:simple sugar transport system permease protein